MLYEATQISTTVWDRRSFQNSGQFGQLLLSSFAFVPTERFDTYYFDTPCGRLRDKAVSLRIAGGQRRFAGTEIKSFCKAVGRLTIRRKVSEPSNSPVHVLANLGPKAFSHDLLSAAGASLEANELVCVGHIRQLRTKWYRRVGEQILIAVGHDVIVKSKGEPTNIVLFSVDMRLPGPQCQQMRSNKVAYPLFSSLARAVAAIPGAMPVKDKQIWATL